MTLRCIICNKALTHSKRKKYCAKCSKQAYREHAKLYRRAHRAEMYLQYKSVRISDGFQPTKKWGKA